MSRQDWIDHDLASEIKQRLDNDLRPEAFGRGMRETEEDAALFFQEKIFNELLGFDRVKSPTGKQSYRSIPTHDWPQSARAENAYLLCEKGNFRTIYVEIESMTRTAEQNAVRALTKTDLRGSWAIDGNYIAIFHEEDSDVWHLLTPYQEDTTVSNGRSKLRRFTIGVGENHRTVAENLSGLTASKPGILSSRIDEAFRVQPVTEKFYEDYREWFGQMENSLREDHSIEEAKKYAHLTLNRLMFFYFLQNKRWLGGRKDFINWFHKQYQQSDDEDCFHSKWLNTLFFEGMTTPEGTQINGDFPDRVVEAIETLPYMNGGLFEIGSEKERNITFSDEILAGVITNFLEEYNFTVTEESPYDVDIAVDPAMLGKIYESLIAEEERGEAGIFYTPRIEVDMMCRVALYEQLCDRANDIEGKEATIIDFLFSDPKEWDVNTDRAESLRSVLREIKVVDPACGSGAFLVGMKQVFSELYRKLGMEVDYSLRKQIVNQNIYGVDIKSWAVRVAEFRLWLSLVEGEDEVPAQRPVLPNFTFNLRVGDSIVQKVGEEFVTFGDLNTGDDELGDLVQELESMQDRFYDGENDIEAEIRDKQKEVLLTYIDSRIEELQSSTGQSQLGGGLTDDAKIEAEEKERQLEELRELKESVGQADSKEAFLWSLAYPIEILTGGFDVVIANPPYVDHQNIIRQDIDPETLDEMDSDRKKSLKSEYKSDLVDYVQGRFDIKPYKRSDLYVYFYFKAIDLLRSNGTLVFISSNTWLDTDYGKRLQQGLLEMTDLKYIIDNRQKRSFENADVNTTITVGNKTDMRHLRGDVRFSAFRQPYDEVVNPDDMGNLLTGGDVVGEFALGNEIGRLESFDGLRNVRIGEGALWRFAGGTTSESGETLGGGDSAKPRGSYKGSKWGQFLRAPSAHFDLLEAGSEVFKPLQDVANIESYLNTGGADDFFFVDLVDGDPQADDEVTIQHRKSGTTWVVEGEFVRPFVESPGQIDKIDISKNTYDSYIISIPESVDLNQTKIEEYVRWGEGDDREYHQASGRKNKDKWWVLGKRAKTNREVVWPNRQNDRHFVAYNPERTVTHRFYRIEPTDEVDTDPIVLAALLNFTPTSLFTEVLASAGLGQGVLDVTGTTLKRVPVVDPEALTEEQRERLGEAFMELSSRKMPSVHQELGAERPGEVEIDAVSSDRYEIDQLIFEELLNIDSTEQNDVYRAVIRTINDRINKAQSV